MEDAHPEGECRVCASWQKIGESIRLIRSWVQRLGEANDLARISHGRDLPDQLLLCDAQLAIRCVGWHSQENQGPASGPDLHNTRQL